MAISLQGLNSQVQFTINPQAGINYSTYSYPEADSTYISPDLDGRVGFQVGPTVRIGKGWWYIQPGLYWIRQGIGFKSDIGPDAVTVDDLKDDIYLKGFQIPLVFGANVINKDAFRLRAQVGFDMGWITGVTKNNYNFDTKYYTSPFYGARAGLGLDILFLTFDLGLFRGFTNVYDQDVYAQEFGRKVAAIKQLGVYANVGFQYTFKDKE